MTTPATPNHSAAPTAEEDYQTLVGLLSAHTAASLHVATMQQAMNVTMHATAEAVRVDHTKAQETLAALEEKLEAMALRHPEWFAKRQSIVTPCGTVKKTKSTKLETDSAEVTVALVEQHHPELCKVYLRVTKELNLDALAALSDVELERIKMRRVKSENYTVTTAKVDLGKAVAAAGRKEAA